MNKKLTIIFSIVALLLIVNLGYLSALEFDNVKRLPELNKDKSFDIGEKNIEYKEIWEKYPNIEIKNAFGFGKTNFRGAITEHTETCGESCESDFEVYHSGGTLIQDKRFLREMDDGSWKEWKVRSYQFQYWGDIDDYETQCIKGEEVYNKINDTYYTPETCEQVKVGSHEGWININVGDELPEGNYQIRLQAEK